MPRNKKQGADQAILQPLPQEELDRRLKEIGHLLRKRREAISGLIHFCSELGISSTRVGRFEIHGGNVNLTTLLQIFHSVGISYEDFIKLLKTENAAPNSSAATPT